MYCLWTTVYAVLTKAVVIKYTATHETWGSHGGSMKTADFWAVTPGAMVEIHILGGKHCFCP
jgi:hypothetical protein